MGAIRVRLICGVILLAAFCAWAYADRFYYAGSIEAIAELQMDVSFTGGNLRGHYENNTSGTRITLRGAYSDNAVTVKAYDARDTHLSTFTGKLENGFRAWTGTWIERKTTRQAPFSVSAVAEYRFIKERNAGTTFTAVYPYFLGRSPLAREANRSLRAALAASQQEMFDVAFKTGPEDPTFGTWRHRWQQQITYYADDLVSVYGLLKVYRGRAHEVAEYHTATFHQQGDMVSLLSLPDLFLPDTPWLAALTAYALRDLRRQQAGPVVRGNVTALTVKDMSAFTISPRGLTVHFLRDVAPYAVTVPYPEIAPYLKPGSPVRRFVKTT